MGKSDNLFLGLLFLGVLAYGGNAGWFKGSGNTYNYITNTETINQLESPPDPASSCSLSIRPDACFVGDSVIGTINAAPNVGCEVYQNVDGAWSMFYWGETDASGVLSDSQTVDYPGTTRLRAICGSCVTNVATLVVNVRPEGGAGPDGAGDGGAGDGSAPLKTPIECQSWANGLGKDSWNANIYNIDDCGGFAWSNCQSRGLILKFFDFLPPNCCGWACE